MRCVPAAQPHPLEPVKHFSEGDKQSALAKVLREQGGNTRGMGSGKVERMLRNFKRVPNDDLVPVFVKEMRMMGKDANTIEAFLKEAIKTVGQKSPTNRTLYDAKHVALAFMMEDPNSTPDMSKVPSEG